MKISKSKVTLAAKIKSSGFEWPQFGKWATQDKDGEVFISGGEFTPVRRSGEVNWCFDVPYKSAGKVEFGVGWFQCILSRAEYSHLYPAPDAKPQFCESVMRSIPEPDEQVWTNPPTIEQLASDYRNANDYAERKRQEADAAKGDVDAKLKALELAGEAIGLLVSPITAKQEPELTITDWRDLQVGDEVECLQININGDDYADERIGTIGLVSATEQSGSSGQTVKLKFNDDEYFWISEWRFIRRP